MDDGFAVVVLEAQERLQSIICSRSSYRHRYESRTLTNLSTWIYLVPKLGYQVDKALKMAFILDVVVTKLFHFGIP